MTKKLSISGPGVLVAAAFIGPGTVTVCSIAGATYGFVLLWAVVLSIIATLVLQEMAARIGLVSQRGLAQVVREQTQNKFLKTISVILILAAIAIGNAAYEAGNISGGLLGLEAIGLPTKAHIGDFAINYWSIIIGALAAVILYVGNYKFIERFLVALVILMSLAFIITAIVTLPNILEVFKGMFVPSLPEGSLLIVVALVGTTVVPYNLFLHASLVKEKWQSVDHLDTVRRDTRVSIILGGLVSIAIIVCAAAIQGSEISTAGLTSAITAPLAVAYVVQGCLGWENNLKSASFRWVWAIILLIGVVIASLGYKPITIIKFAQIANGILLPVIAGYLLWIANKKNLLNQYVNTKIQNIIAIVIWLLAFGLGLWSILRVAGIIT